MTTLPADKFDTDAKFIRPADLPTRAPLDKLAVLPGFNTRVKDDDYNERVAAVSESILAHGFFEDKPFAVTQIEGDDTIYIYDGEHRFDGAKAAVLDGAEFPDGLPIAWAKDGATVRDLTLHLIHGNNSERLNMVESAAVVRRLQNLGLTKPEIVEAFGKTSRHIDNLFVLSSGNQSIKKAVASGKIAGAEAVKLLRKDPKTAAAKVAEAVKAAEEKGKAKATPKTMASVSEPKGPKTKTVPMSINFAVGKGMGETLKEIAKMIREFVEHDDKSDLVQTDALVRFSVTTVDRAAEAEAVAKAEEKAKKAAEAEAAKIERQKAKDAEAAAKAADKAKKAKEQAALLAEAAKKGSAAKKPAATKDKAAGETKPRRRAGKLAQAEKAPEATQAPATAESAPTEALAALSDESMGGL